MFAYFDFTWKLLSLGMTLYMFFMLATVLRFLYENLKMFADTINEYPFTFKEKH